MWMVAVMTLGLLLGDASMQELSEEKAKNGNQPAEEVPDAGRKCFVCYSCNRVESSQSLSCPEGFGQCMTIQLITGEIDRMCSNENKCQKELGKPEHKKVRCCDSDNCNGQTSIRCPPTWTLLLVIAAIIYSNS